MYKIKYLPIAQKDLINIVDYISDILKNPQAALELLNNIDHSISLLKQFPYSCRIYPSKDSLETEYRLLSVKNYLIFYVVVDYDIEIHRIVFAKKDIGNLIE